VNAPTLTPELLKKIAERAEKIRGPWMSDYKHVYQTTESTILAYLELKPACTHPPGCTFCSWCGFSTKEDQS
jgi:hypothetical protein